ncbi:penicillin-binding transpeptidase domain-containing protein, partial [Arthrobacter sp. JCM 19049]|uniref:penicillin-binding transpeptidase domain-containing protein n=1 Tax=Arthrobacter sp. JCM 19049 TaxID=1460643 RepID=UPI000A419F23
ALLGKYAPGSSFKVISALAMLRDGATPGTKVACPATTTVDGKAFKNYDGYPSSALGQLPLSEALAQSCNTVFVEAGADLAPPRSPRRLARWV